MIKLIIFDLDGVLVDAKEIHYQALNKALSNIDKKYVIILSKSKFSEKLLCLFSILIIFWKAPFKLRDRIFLGYLKKSLIYSC